MVVAFVAAACGQQPGVRVADLEPGDIQGFMPAGQAGVAADDDYAYADDGDDYDDAFAVADDDWDGDDEFATAPGESGDGTQGGGQDQGTQQQQTRQQGTQTQDSGGSGQQQRQVRGSDRTGVTDTTITLGAHAPVTGAAPLPQRSFQEAIDLYWRWITDAKGETVLGRSEVRVQFRDDRYDPSSAIQVCRELARNSFSLLGGGGTDQIQACGRFANQNRVPYVSAGVTERGLRDTPWYFGASMSYKQQGPLLAQYIARNFPGKKVAAVVTDTPNFDDAVEGWEAGVARQGLDYYRTLRHPKGDTGWYNSYAEDLARAEVEVLFMLTAPVDYLHFAQQAAQQGYRPQYVGVGVTMGLNAVLGSGCGGNPGYVHGGVWFSPFPGLDWARQNEPEFFEASQRFGTVPDDLALALWGSAKVSNEVFQRYGQVYGNDLTREDFRDFLSTQRDIRTNIFPTLNFAPNNNFGANTVHVLRADCEAGEHRTIATHVSGF